MGKNFSHRQNTSYTTNFLNDRLRYCIGSVYGGQSIISPYIQRKFMYQKKKNTVKYICLYIKVIIY